MSPISELLASLPRARNFAEFVMADRFLGKHFQCANEETILAAMDAMTEICQACYRKQPEDRPLSPFTMRPGLMEFGSCLVCDKSRPHMWREGSAHHKKQFDITMLENRTMLLLQIAAYNLHLVLRDNLRLTTQGACEIVFNAATLQKARETFYSVFCEMISVSPWFMRYHELLDDIERITRTPVYNIDANMMVYHNVGVVIHCGLTRIEQLRGHTNLLVLMDAINSDKARREEMHAIISKTLLVTTVAMEENVYSKGKTTGPVPMFVHSY